MMSEWIKCWYCNGRKYIKYICNDDYPGEYEEIRRCQKCNGTGKTEKVDDQ